MTSVGLVGGLGPESTVDYYRRILEAWKREDPSSAPSMVIDSLDVQRAIAPLLLPEPSIAGVPALDTTALHVVAIVKRLRSPQGAGA
jgi:aspartate/glutamate racemase